MEAKQGEGFTGYTLSSCLFCSEVHFLPFQCIGCELKCGLLTEATETLEPCQSMASGFNFFNSGNTVLFF